MTDLAGRSWFEGCVLYQIYPRSFQDSNDDGVGDINGIRQRLDYLKNDLGIDCIWTNPIYTSPMKDSGYDIKDYCGVDPTFGTLEDFDRLVAEAHAKGLHIIIDLVPNHTSDEHPWFRESETSKTNNKADWYIWHDAKPDGSVPNNWLSALGGSVWEWHEGRKQYYLHSFLKDQPDLNWENAGVRQAMAEVMRYWLDRGVDGFRVDAVDLMAKSLSFEDEPANPDYDPIQGPYMKLDHIYTRDIDRVFDHIRFLADVVAEYEDRLLILESYILERQRPDLYWRYYHEINKPFCIPFNFELVFMNWSASEIQKFIDAFQQGLRDQDTPIYVLGNHDNPRFATKVRNIAADRAGALLLLSLPGISHIYNGEEIGLRDVAVPRRRSKDAIHRERNRTPMQWSPASHAGFSKATPWLPVDKDYKMQNVEVELANPSSMFYLYQTLIKLRRTNNALRYGKYRPGPAIPNVVSFVRETADTSVSVFVNISDKQVRVKTEANNLLISSSSDRRSFKGTLAPYEGVILASSYNKLT